jgi:hypothetical protein
MRARAIVLDWTPTALRRALNWGSCQSHEQASPAAAQETDIRPLTARRTAGYIHRRGDPSQEMNMRGFPPGKVQPVIATFHWRPST